MGTVASGGSTGAVPRPSAGQEPLLRPQPHPQAEIARSPQWEEIFQAASPAQQRDLLELARTQGLLYWHQLPAATNGTGTAEPSRPFPPSLFNGRLDDLEPVRVVPLEVLDEALDTRQREAVAKALLTPDCCLIQGFPGTGKSRVVAEIVTQAAARGQRVLLLAFSPAAIDRVLELVANREMICPIRCVGNDENRDSLPPLIAALTYAERLRQLRENPLTSARQELTAADQRCFRRQQDEAVLERLQELAARLQELEEQIKALQQQSWQMAANVEQEVFAAENPGVKGASSFSASCQAASQTHRENLRRLDDALANLRSRIEEKRQDQAKLAPRLDHDRFLAEAKQNGRWWTGAWWRATFHGGAVAELSETEGQWQTIQGDLDRFEEELQRSDRGTRPGRQDFRRRPRRPHQSGNRPAPGHGRGSRDGPRHELALLQEKWLITGRELDPESPCPGAITVPAVQAAREAWYRLVQQEQEQRSFTRQPGRLFGGTGRNDGGPLDRLRQPGGGHDRSFAGGCPFRRPGARRRAL